MNFFEAIISPFIFFIEKVFLFSYTLTGNYGVSIILLSLSVSLLLLPVFIYIEKSKKKDDVIKQKMQPLIDEIKRVYKGQERYYYIKTINRQHNYSSLKALIPILSLLIQIPFFIAAYQYLEHFEGLQGVSFAFIKDLGKPDAVFGVVNILPILMTLVNLITVYYYTRLGDGSERKQMLVIAIAFLVLLFNLPAGLVLYWTMNNVFSFFRLFVTNPEVFKNKEKNKSKIQLIKSSYKQQYSKLKIVFISILVLLFVIQFNWAFSYNFDDIYFRLFASFIITIVLTLLYWFIIENYTKYKTKILKLQVKPKVFFYLIVSVIYFHLTSQFYFNENNLPLSLIALFLLVISEFYAIIYFTRLQVNSIVKKIIIYIVYTVVVYQFLSLYSLYINSDLNISLAKINILLNKGSFSDVVVPGIAIIIFSIYPYTKETGIKFQKLKKSHYSIYILSVFFVLGLIYFWKPLIVFASSPDVFSFPGINIIKYNYIIFSELFVLLILVYVLSPKLIKKILLYLSIMLVLISFIYSLLFPIDLGSLQVSKFTNDINLAKPVGYYFLELALLLGVFYFVDWIFKKQYFKLTFIVLLLLNIIVITQSITSAIKSKYFYVSLLEQNTKKVSTIKFSKNKKNIVFVLADGYQGWYINKLMKENQEFTSDFSGFQWFSNIVSASNYTHSSLCALLEGEKGQLKYINNNSQISYQQKIRNASLSFVEKAKKNGYEYSSTLMHYSGLTDKNFDEYIPFWNEVWTKYSSDIKLGNNKDVWKKRLYENALLYSVPLFLKPRIYNKSEWLYKPKVNEKSSEKSFKYSYERYNFPRLLPYISRAVETGKPRFIYIHDHSIHAPWNIVNDEGYMETDVHPFTVDKWYMEHFAKWIKWMKREGVYDNTKIIIVSDHGAAWGMYKGEPDIESPINWSNNPLKISKKIFWRLNPLLLVKDFNAKGELKVNNKLMSNYNAIDFLYNQDTVIYNKNRIIDTYFTIWKGNVLDEKTLGIYKHYKVKNNTFDLTNWQEVKE